VRRGAELDARERELARASVDPDEARLAEIETRLAELREAEKAFLRTHDELAARSEAVTMREELVAQRERELQDRESGWGSADLTELEARLRRLESQRTTAQPQGFTGGIRKLQEGGRGGGRT
jgi:chromosome segregation ATPase